MDAAKLTEICDKGCEAKIIVSSKIERSKIKKVTVRSKGEFLSERFFYICGGECKFVLNNKKNIIANKGDIIYLPPDATYVCYWNDDPECSALSVRFHLLSSGKHIQLSKKMSIVCNDKFGDYKKMLEEMCAIYSEGKIGYKIKCQSILLEMIYNLLPDLIGSPDTKKDKAVYKGIFYIENNYMGEISVNEIARMCSMSPSSFRQKFAAIKGMSPIKYKNYLLMKKAAELLRAGELNAEQVAIELGIDDPYYFSRLFKSFYGVPPGKYKRG